MQNNLPFLLGWIGAIAYILGYALVTSKKISGSSSLFHGFNLVGGVGVTISAFSAQDTPSVVLNFIWGLLALYGLLTSSKKN